MEQAASRLAKSLQAKLFSRLAWLAWFFGLEKAWLARPKLGLACKQKKLAYVRLGLACMKAWLDKTSLNQAFFRIETFIIRYHFLSEICYCTIIVRDAKVLQHPEGDISSQGANPRGMKLLPRDVAKHLHPKQ